MPVLSNPKHELFAQELAKGATAEMAYAKAGFSSHRQNAHRLMTNDDILRRVEELQTRAAAKLEVTLQWLMEKAEEARAKAMTNGQIGPAVAAIKELGVLSGHRVEKRENTNRNADDLSDDELLRIASGRGEEASPPRAARQSLTEFAWSQGFEPAFSG